VNGTSLGQLTCIEWYRSPSGRIPLSPPSFFNPNRYFYIVSATRSTAPLRTHYSVADWAAYIGTARYACQVAIHSTPEYQANRDRKHAGLGIVDHLELPLLVPGLGIEGADRTRARSPKAPVEMAGPQYSGPRDWTRRACAVMVDSSMRRTISICLLLIVAISLRAQTVPPEVDKQLAHDIYKEFIEVPSGYTTGSTTPVVEAAARRLKAAGFSDSDILLGGPSPKKFNLVVRYHGSGARKPLLLLAHTDVVEAKREDWSIDPFTFNEKDGYYYGRGTGDDKAQAAVWVATLIRFKREGFTPDRDIIVALTADEEGGGPYSGINWLIKNHRDLIDADLCLNEGGWGEEVSGKKVSNDLQVSEKYVINFTFEVHNKGGHSSIPVPDNAIYHLAGALKNLSAFGFPLKTNQVTAAYFTEMAKIETGPTRADLAKVAQGSQTAMERVAAASPEWNSTLRTTCVATMLAGGHASNALPQLATATVNCRVLPEDSPQYVLSTLKKVVGDDQVAISSTREDVAAPPSPLRPDVLKAMQAASQREFPGVPVVPTMMTGATDGRFLRAIGIPTYGIQGFFFDRDDIRFHGRDERMKVQSFYEGQAFLYELVKTLSTPAH
jgi:acetylornithine deacetylase/succinyl-diaminopimelate desuccinylase-like protein